MEVQWYLGFLNIGVAPYYLEWRLGVFGYCISSLSLLETSLDQHLLEISFHSSHHLQLWFEPTNDLIQ